MYASTLPPMTRTLTALSAILTKTEAHCAEHKIEPAALLTFRLFPDMLPFTRQVQFVCDFACRAAARLAAVDVPSQPDTETSFAQLQTRVGTAISYLASFTPAQLEGAETRSITLKMRGEDMTFSGQDYVSLFALPNFYFHAATAYNILRHNGVPLGKADFMGA